jgi:hypothetical protein
VAEHRSTRRRDTRRLRVAAATSLIVILGIGVALAVRLAPSEGRSGTTVSIGPVHLAEDPIPDEYIVVLRDGARGHVPDTAKALAGKYGGAVGRTYTAALQGFTLHANAAAVEALNHDPQVSYIEQDGVVHGAGTETGPVWNTSLSNGGLYTCPCPPWSTTSPLPWNLDRIDQASGALNGAFSYLGTGQGVTAYIIDSGIRTDHTEFSGRASVGADFVADGRNGQDCNGHGTHVAGLVGGATFGVAKQVTLRSVRVLDCANTTSVSRILAGVDWVTNDHRAGDPAVANLSVGGPKDQAENDAVSKAIGRGVTFVVSAGNWSADACNYSPASEPSAITVGASWIVDANGALTLDHPADFSNTGSCIDLWAPGQEIVSSWFTSPTASASDFGTSMASPLVAGMAAQYLSAVPQAGPVEVVTALRSNAVHAVTNVLIGDSDRLLNTNFGGTAAALRSNLLPNSAFETGSLDPWVKRNLAAGVTFNAIKNPARAQNGAWFAEASTTTANGSVSVDFVPLPLPTVGTAYSAGVWVRSADGTTITGTLAMWGLGGTSESKTTKFTADGTWRFVTVPMDVKYSGHTALRAEVYMDNVGKAYDIDTTQTLNTLLSNASFEMGNANPWKKINAAAAVNLTTYLNAARAKDGASYAETNTSAPGGSVGQDILTNPQVAPYAYSVWIRSATGAALSGNLNLWALGGTSESVSVPFTADGTWRLVTAPLTVRIAGHTSLRAEMYMNTLGQNYDFDGAAVVFGSGR